MSWLQGLVSTERDGYFNNRLLTGVDVSGTTTHTYDNNGLWKWGQESIAKWPEGCCALLTPDPISKADITTNTWDGENRLVQVEHPSGDVTTYAYNGDGLRVLQGRKFLVFSRQCSVSCFCDCLKTEN